VTQPYEPTPPSTAAEALESLKSLPSFEDTQARVQDAMNEIVRAATDLIPSIAWQTADNADTGKCPKPYDQSDGRSSYLANRFAEDLSISEEQWAGIQQAARAAAARIDATEVQVMHDGPGDHDVGFYGPAGVFVKVSYAGNLVVAGYTGCRLPSDGS